MSRCSEFEEEVARAICVADGKDPDEDWREIRQPGGGIVVAEVAVENPARWTIYVPHARAAIRTIKEKSEGKKEAHIMGDMKFQTMKKGLEVFGDWCDELAPEYKPVSIREHYFSQYQLIQFLVISAQDLPQSCKDDLIKRLGDVAMVTPGQFTFEVVKLSAPAA